MPLTRRQFLIRSAALASAWTAGCARSFAQPRFVNDPYRLGIASGYPHAAGFTLWTRLAPRPLDGGGMEPVPVEVHWEVAHDEGFKRIAASGRAAASPQWAHSVHVDVKGLEPAREYWYRFRAGDAVSPHGRTRTAPRPDAANARLRLAFTACQQYEHGYYTAYRHMAREGLDLVVHLGDYIYESTWGRTAVREHAADEPLTLGDYRNRYAQYKGDADLQAAHAAFAWIVTWDDHEVDNDYANDRSQDLDDPEVFLARRAAAYRAYYEHQPLPAWARPRGRDMRIHGTHEYGRLARFYVLDARQYKSHQACPRPDRGGSNVVRADECPERLDPSRSMLGREQERWLHESLGRSAARWNVIAQQTCLAPVDRLPGPGEAYWTDGWDGYPQARERLFASLKSERVSNPIVLSGDIHMAAVADLHAIPGDAKSPVIATEFVCPPMTSQGPSAKRVAALLDENFHIKFANGSRKGYATVELTPERCIARYRTVGSVTVKDSPVTTLVTYATAAGRPGVEKG
jgi:alkaline phosphatase D